ncbi:MAG: carboxypeptidase regulatory-like domain-containing protein [Myxococcales bacterium]|nr:carboxypeptidase regulatory-like domain-containing protein [Myxococcales bacterium]
MRLRTRAGADPIELALQQPSARPTAAYGGAAYGGALDDSDDDLANLATLPTPPPPRARPYQPTAGLTGSVEGTVTAQAAPPPFLVTTCGILPTPRPAARRAAGTQPTPRTASMHTVGGVLVTVEPLMIGRALPSFASPAAVGGTVIKRGCTLAPTLQIVTPLPASVTIHGDATAAHLLATLPTRTQTIELLAAGRVIFPAQLGVTRIEAADGSLGAAWVIASDTPYYALTDDDGRFRIGELAPGTYHLTFWRAPSPTLTDGKLTYGDPSITHRSIRVDATRPARLDVRLAR